MLHGASNPIQAKFPAPTVWAEGVTYVLGGMSCHPCDRNRPCEIGRGDWIRTSDPLLPKQMRYQAALRPDSEDP